MKSTVYLFARNVLTRGIEGGRGIIMSHEPRSHFDSASDIVVLRQGMVSLSASTLFTYFNRSRF